MHLIQTCTKFSLPNWDTILKLQNLHGIMAKIASGEKWVCECRYRCSSVNFVYFLNILNPLNSNLRAINQKSIRSEAGRKFAQHFLYGHTDKLKKDLELKKLTHVKAIEAFSFLEIDNKKKGNKMGVSMSVVAFFNSFNFISLRIYNSL